MRHVLLASLLLVTPVQAEEPSLMERGAELFLEGLMKELEPAIDEMGDLAREFGPALQDFARVMGPALRDMMEEIEDWSLYEVPEILDNGDIIIRRKRIEAREEPGIDI